MCSVQDKVGEDHQTPIERRDVGLLEGDLREVGQLDSPVSSVSTCTCVM